MTEIEEGGLPEPIPGAGDPQQAAADAIANAEGVERELHSFEIDPTQVWGSHCRRIKSILAGVY